MRIAIVTDSTSGLMSYAGGDAPDRVVPLTVAFGDTIYTDGVDLTAEAFYPLLTAARTTVTTAQPSPVLFVEAYTELAAAGYDVIVSIHCASVLSGTVKASMDAARNVSIDVQVIDTKVIGAALGLSVRAAVRAAVRGEAVASVVARAEQTAAQSRTFFIVDDLSHLRRGGRLNASQAAVGQALNIKPLLTLDPDGRVIVVQRNRTWQRAITQLVTQVDAAFQQPVYAVIAHTNVPDRARIIAAQLGAQVACEHVDYEVLPPVVGAHVGSGAAGIAAAPAALFEVSSTG